MAAQEAPIDATTVQTAGDARIHASTIAGEVGEFDLRVSIRMTASRRVAAGAAPDRVMTLTTVHTDDDMTAMIEILDS